jgi:hypothetical protein
MRALTAAALLRAVAVPAARGQEARPAIAATDTLLLSAQLDSFRGADDGAALEGTWLRQTAAGHWSAGFAGHRIGAAEWTLGTFGASRVVAPRWRLTGDLRLGPGEVGGERFTYRSLSIGAEFSPRPSRLMIGLSHRYVDVRPSEGSLGRLGVWWALRPGVSAELAFMQSLGGNLEVDLFSGRIDVSRTTPGLTAGFAAGSTAGVLVGPLPAGPLTENDYREVFAGVRFSGRDRPLEILLDHQRASGLRKLSAIVVYRLPLAGRDSAP